MPESEPRLIRGYLQVLAAQLPGPIVEELADGLTETYRSYRSRGLPADAAAMRRWRSSARRRRSWPASPG
jgi:hypothetical protein